MSMLHVLLISGFSLALALEPASAQVLRDSGPDRSPPSSREMRPSPEIDRPHADGASAPDRRARSNPEPRRDPPMPKPVPSIIQE